MPRIFYPRRAKSSVYAPLRRHSNPSPHRLRLIRIPAALIPLTLWLLGRIRIGLLLLRILRSVLLLRISLLRRILRWVRLLWVTLRWIIRLLGLRCRLLMTAHGLHARFGNSSRGLDGGTCHRACRTQWNCDQRTTGEAERQHDGDEKETHVERLSPEQTLCHPNCRQNITMEMIRPIAVISCRTRFGSMRWEYCAPK